jgi:hypothetical protein
LHEIRDSQYLAAGNLAISRHASPRGGFLFRLRSRLLEVADVLMRFDHVASWENYWLPVVPELPVVGLDSPVTPPPPLTSFTGFRSRIMASFMSFLTRRQADRTILMFGICVFMFKYPHYFVVPF